MGLTGIIARLVRDRGFGFIRDNSSGLEYFFHRDDLKHDEEFSILKEGQTVAFEHDMTEKGRRARLVDAH